MQGLAPRSAINVQPCTVPPHMLASCKASKACPPAAALLIEQRRRLPLHDPKSASDPDSDLPCSPFQLQWPTCAKACDSAASHAAQLLVAHLDGCELVVGHRVWHNAACAGARKQFLCLCWRGVCHNLTEAPAAMCKNGNIFYTRLDACLCSGSCILWHWLDLLNA